MIENPTDTKTIKHQIDQIFDIDEREIRAHCEKIKDAGAPSAAVFVRDIFARPYVTFCAPL